MGFRQDLGGGALLRLGLLAIAASAWTSPRALAHQLFHMKRTVWGCFDPNVAPYLNDARDPRRSDPQWVTRTSVVGQCVIISTRSIWEPLSQNYNGLTYVAYRGTTGKPGSFWVPTAAIDFTAPVEVIAPQPHPQPPSPEADQPQAPQIASAPLAAAPAPAVQVPIAPVAISQPTPRPEPDQAPASVAPEAATSGSGSSGGGVVAVLLLLLFAWIFRRTFRRRTSSSRRHVAAEGPVISAPRGSTRAAGEAVSARKASLDGQILVSPAGAAGWSEAKTANWYPPGSAVTVAGAIIANGMVYVGRGGRQGDHDSSFIDPALPVAKSSASAGRLGYWPSYRTISPESRRRYLEWLASGKRASDAEIGYVFLYFYGLERRLLIEEPPFDEVRALVAEIERLRTIYAGNRSFDGYSRRVVEAVGFLQAAQASASTPFVPDFAAPAGQMPLALKVAIAREVVAGRPLDFELAAAALFGLKDFWSVHPHAAGKARPAFLALLRVRFPKAFPTGFPLRNRNACRLQLAYRGASAGLSLDLGSRLGLKDLPDPAMLTWTKLLNHAAAVAMEVAPYARILVDNPARANSLSGLTSCPTELRDVYAAEARQWLEALPSPAAVTFGELAGHALGTVTGKWTIRHQRDVSEALSIVGYAMEPDPEDGTERVEDGTTVQVFRCSGRPRSRSLEVASAAAMFVAAVGRTADGSTQTAAELWLSELPSRLRLSPDEATRLRARLAWLGTKGVALTKAKRTLGEATQEEKEFCAWSATVAAGATGDVGKPQVAVLEAIHDALGLPRSTVYSGLHAGIGAAAAAANEPILVSDEVREVVHPIPRPSSESGPMDGELGRLNIIRAETNRVSALLAEIFVEEEQPPEPVEDTDGGPLAGLDARHAALLTKLLSHTEWPRDAFEVVASEAGLMPNGAMETINEWSFDYHGDALLEDGLVIVVNHALRGAEAAAAE